MRTLKALLVSSALSLALVLCLAGSAMAAEIHSVNSTVTLDSDDATQASVDWSVTSDGNFPPINVSTFAVNAWDETCSAAGYPYGADVPNPVLALAMSNGESGELIFDTAQLELPKGVELCVGTVAESDGEYMVDASPIEFDEASFDYNGDPSSTTSSITIPISITPGGLAATYSLSYFKQDVTEDCNDPFPTELASAVSTDPATISDDLWAAQDVYPEITGLDKETTYCVTVNLSNAAGNDPNPWSSYDTTGDVPVVTDESYTAGVDSIDFSLELTPNVGDTDAMLVFQYFKKVGDECTLVPSEESYYGYVWLTYTQGYTPGSVSDTIPDLDSGSTYCIRAFSLNRFGGSVPGGFHEVTLVEQQNATVSDFHVVPSSEGADAELQFSVDDHGAAEDTGDESSFYVDVYGIGHDRCNTEDYHGSSDVIIDGEEGTFSGSDDFAYGLNGIEYDTEYCAVVHTESAWGDEYDTIAYLPFKGGRAPQISDSSSTKTHNSITANATVDPGNFATDFYVRYFQAPGNVACADYVGPKSVSDTGTTEPNVSTSESLSRSIADLAPSTTYCLKFVAENAFGSQETGWFPETTNVAPDNTPPSKPTGLASSNVTQNSASLSWNAATDNVAVTGYKVYQDNVFKNAVVGATGAATLQCGASSLVRISAVDAAGNESALSDPLQVVGAACPVDPPAGGGTNGGGGNGGGGNGGGTTDTQPAKRCYAPISSRSSKGRAGKKGYSVKVSGAVSADGQSIVFSSIVKGTSVTFKVDGKKATAKKGAITLTNNPALVTVSFKVGKKTLVFKFQTKQRTC